ncbi:MAG: HAMP domain-containing sensor histidine kinase [Anaerolineales bacterium]
MVLVVGLTVAVVLLIQRRRMDRVWRGLTDSYPLPAMVFYKTSLRHTNREAERWSSHAELQALVRDAHQQGQNVVRTIPAVEGQSIQARALFVPPVWTFLILEDLESAQRQQSFYRNFIQNVSHELKTPLTVIQGHASKIGGEPADRESWTASVRIISEEAKRLTQLVDNLLTLARLESPSFALDLAPINMGALLEESILQLYELAEERGIALSLNSPPGLPRLHADRVRLKQVVLNLLDNALKYTPSGGKVQVELSEVPEVRRIRCRVQDSGEGIPEDDLPYIFDKLYRVRRSGGRTVEGSGLGLTIARQIVDAHEGAIRVESTVGQGSIFTFELPYENQD